MEVSSKNTATDIKPNALDLSVAVITLNEEFNLPRLLKSLPKYCEIVVVDSGSTDRTVEIARSFGARVENRAFDDYAAQKNCALNLANRGWILCVDADEELTPELMNEITAIVGRSKDRSDVDNLSGYEIGRKLVFMERSMKFGKTSDHPLRLIRRGSGKFVSQIHEKLELTSGRVARIEKGFLRHFSYRDLTDYFLRFNNYTTRIALNHFRLGKSAPPLLFHVLRPLWEFASRYILRLGFLDGHPGFCYALFSSVYTFVKYEKLRELRSRERAS